MSAVPKESAILASIVRRLTVLRDGGTPLWWLKVHGGPMQPAGVPDLLVCSAGRFVALEVKRPGESATPLQQETMRRIARAGGATVVVRSAEEAVGALGVGTP